jgi:hypothetical protein
MPVLAALGCCGEISHRQCQNWMFSYQVRLPRGKSLHRDDEEEEEDGENCESFGGARLSSSKSAAIPDDRGWRRVYHNPVVPGKDCKLIKSSYQIPPRSDVSGYEDGKSEDGEGVHESRPIAWASP